MKPLDPNHTEDFALRPVTRSMFCPLGQEAPSNIMTALPEPEPDTCAPAEAAVPPAPAVRRSAESGPW